MEAGGFKEALKPRLLITRESPCAEKLSHICKIVQGMRRRESICEVLPGQEKATCCRAGSRWGHWLEWGGEQLIILHWDCDGRWQTKGQIDFSPDVNGTTIPLKIDTGAQVNILLKNKLKISQMKIHLRTYNDEPNPTKGKCTLTCEGQSINSMFILVVGNRQPILWLRNWALLREFMW